jgi:hypothetical protein
MRQGCEARISIEPFAASKDLGDKPLVIHKEGSSPADPKIELLNRLPQIDLLMLSCTRCDFVEPLLGGNLQTGTLQIQGNPVLEAIIEENCQLPE